MVKNLPITNLLLLVCGFPFSILHDNNNFYQSFEQLFSYTSTCQPENPEEQDLEVNSFRNQIRQRMTVR